MRPAVATALAALGVAWAAAGCLERGRDGGEATADPLERAVRDPTGQRAEPPARRPGAHVAEVLWAEEPDGPADPDATVTVALEAEPAHLDPSVAQDALAVRVALGDVFEGLLCRDQPRDPLKTCLAATYRSSADQRTWTFYLRPAVRFHDGSGVDAADVIASFAAARDGSILASELRGARAVAVPDTGGLVVRVQFREPAAGRGDLFARLPIVSAAQSAAERRRQPLGTGPLRVSRWTAGHHIELERWRGYWGQAARAARVRYRFYGSRTAARMAAARGELDVILQVPVDEALRAAEREQDDEGPLSAFRYPMPAFLAAVYNARRSPLDRAQTRRALTMLLDRSGIIAALFAGQAEPIAGPFLPGTVPGPAPLPFEPDRAARLAGAGHRPLSVLVPGESATMARIADIWAADARAVFELEVIREPFTRVLERLRAGDFDVAMMAFSTGPAVDLYPRFHSGESENYGGIADAELDRALERARLPEGAEAPGIIAERLHALQPYAFIASDVRLGLVRSGIGGFGRAGPRSFGRFLWRQR